MLTFSAYCEEGICPQHSLSRWVRQRSGIASETSYQRSDVRVQNTWVTIPASSPKLESLTTWTINMHTRRVIIPASPRLWMQIISLWKAVGLTGMLFGSTPQWSVCTIIESSLSQSGLTSTEQPRMGRHVERRRSLYLLHRRQTPPPLPHARRLQRAEISKHIQYISR